MSYVSLQNFVHAMMLELCDDLCRILCKSMPELCRNLCRIFVLTTLELCHDVRKNVCHDAHKKLCRDAKHILRSRLNTCRTPGGVVRAEVS